jgi:hypothetical protein
VGKGKQRSYRTSVHANGIVHIGDAYVDELGLQPRDELSIEVLEDGFRLKVLHRNLPETRRDLDFLA